MPTRLLRTALLVALAGTSTTAAHAQRRPGSQIGPVVFNLTANTGLCLSGGDGWRAGAPLRINPCGPANTGSQAVIYDAETNYLRPAASPELCIMAENGTAGSQLVVNVCVAGRDANRAWNFTRGSGLWLRDNDAMCARPEGAAGNRVLLAPCRGGPTATWSCTAVPSATPLDGGWPPARVQEWCDR